MPKYRISKTEYVETEIELSQEELLQQLNIELSIPSNKYRKNNPEPPTLKVHGTIHDKNISGYISLTSKDFPQSIIDQLRALAVGLIRQNLEISDSMDNDQAHD